MFSPWSKGPRRYVFLYNDASRGDLAGAGPIRLESRAELLLV